MFNVLCISNIGKEDFLTVGNVYEVVGVSKYDGINDTFLDVRCDHCSNWRSFRRNFFKYTQAPATPRFPFNVRCRHDYTWVFPPGGGHRKRSLAKYITVGHVYSVIEIRRQGYYIMLPDHGTHTEELPEENFEFTNKPVTVNPNREQEENDSLTKAENARKAHEEWQQQQSLRDSLDLYYNPDAYHARQRAKQNRVRVLQSLFTCGIPYE